jgi:hypothetical protein
MKGDGNFNERTRSSQMLVQIFGFEILWKYDPTCKSIQGLASCESLNWRIDIKKDGTGECKCFL